VNQIEVHPYLGNEEVRTTNAELGIVTEAWSPIGKGRVLKDPTDWCDRQPPRQDACASDTALAHSTRRRHLPQVDNAGAD
jgi:diketogulonate reductase-like aldo/keto reductase